MDLVFLEDRHCGTGMNDTGSTAYAITAKAARALVNTPFLGWWVWGLGLRLRIKGFQVVGFRNESSGSRKRYENTSYAPR